MSNRERQQKAKFQLDHKSAESLLAIDEKAIEKIIAKIAKVLKGENGVLVLTALSRSYIAVCLSEGYQIDICVAMVIADMHSLKAAKNKAAQRKGPQINAKRRSIG